MDYIPKYFKLYELVPPEAFALTNINQWWFFDPRILYTADKIRARYGKMLCNTYYWGGENKYRGWRPFDCLVGARFSQHKFGRALDLVPFEATVEEIREDIRQGEFNYVSCIELEVSWLHIDVRNYKGLMEVKP